MDSLDNEYLNKIKSKLSKICASREKSIKQIQEKLQKYNLSSAQENSVIDFLKKENYIDEQRFAKAFAHDRFMFFKWGKIKIKTALKYEHRIDEKHINQSLNALDSLEYNQMLKKLATAKWKSLKNEKNSLLKKSKVVKYLESKGYESELIYKTIKTLPS